MTAGRYPESELAILRYQNAALQLEADRRRVALGSAMTATLVAVPGAERAWLRFPADDDDALNAAGALVLAVNGAADERELGLFWIPSRAIDYVVEHLRGAGVEVAVWWREDVEER